ncbi:hypothetical protein NKW84_07910 [Acetobacter senegalensis]|uniref:hypothetical protein n=1 Tax=Acetobacter senegalensis TaxID=446692 RepID=UPI0020A04AE9|nr:hypothetical protein [Acetobacter senegalensis]MCP1195782.1 hypothetical protein [Acetobacter senegalensis]
MRLSCRICLYLARHSRLKEGKGSVTLPHPVSATSASGIRKLIAPSLPQRVLPT